ncbi:phage major capsid protein [Kaistia sp. UC242_56]|uniref:phage major capsid protein n=1 Tax=Kaistia sp. UC242_56 TaxID=3374625 RepID=UPI0037AB53EF
MTKHFRSALLVTAAPFETKEAGDDDDPILAAVEELKASSAEFQTKQTDTLGKISDRLDKVEAKANRLNAGKEKPEDGPPIERKAFTGYLRAGRESLSPDEVKALTIGDDTAGGYLAPAEFSTEIVKGIVEFSPVRQAARVGSIASGSIILPKRTGRPTAHWVGETEDRSETESSYGQMEISAHEMACFVDVSNRLLEDAAVNVEAEVGSDLAEEFGRLEGVSFLTGDGVKKPLGLLKDPDVIRVPTGNAATLGAAPADLLITALYSLPATYRTRSAWMMNGATLSAIRKLKDGQGNFLWQPAFVAGQPETILGYPVIEALDMPDIGAGTEPIIFGDFASAYRIYDRLALSILRDPYSKATNGLTRFHARRRVGGGMVQAEALRKIRCATS